MILKCFNLVDNRNIAGLVEPAFQPCIEHQPLIQIANISAALSLNQQLRTDEILGETRNHTKPA
jgi:hypothetical protein